MTTDAECIEETLDRCFFVMHSFRSFFTAMYSMNNMKVVTLALPYVDEVKSHEELHKQSKHSVKRLDCVVLFVQFFVAFQDINQLSRQHLLLEYIG